MKIILASASPQRKSLLAGLGITFDVIPSAVDEAACGESDPARRAEILATLKARDIARKHPSAVVIGCDTLVVAPNGHLLEKPVDQDDARRMLTLQSSKTSVVHSGLTVIHDGKEASGLSSSSVTFKKLSAKDIDWWMGTKLWEGRSGAFQIDGPGQLMIERIEGDWSSIVGLPVFLLGKLMQEIGASLC